LRPGGSWQSLSGISLVKSRIAIAATGQYWTSDHTVFARIGEIMERFSIDESGYTGFDLLNPDQRFQGATAISITVSAN